MTQLLSAPCDQCGTAVSPYALACERCGHLVHRAELERLAAEAAGLEPHDPVGAILRWRQCLQLMPPAAPQYAEVYHRAAALAAMHMPNAGALPYVEPPAHAAAEDDTPGTALLKTGGSMLVSIFVYAALFAVGGSVVGGLLFAVGIVVLILVHEMGHVAAMRWYGLRAGPPIFIPFMGALINLREPPPNAKIEAVVGIGGPIAGTVGAVAVYAVYLGLPDSPTSELTHLLAYLGFFINLFNMLPVPPLDGGRITAAVNPKVWMLGIAGLVAMIVHTIYEGRTPFLLVLILLFALPRVMATLSRRRRRGMADTGEPKPDPYYAISRRATWTIGTLYIVLGVFLLVMTWLTKDALAAVT